MNQVQKILLFFGASAFGLVGIFPPGGNGRVIVDAETVNLPVIAVAWITIGVGTAAGLFLFKD